MNKFQIKTATKKDIPLLLQLFAEYANSLNLGYKVITTAEDLAINLFGKRPYAEIIIGYYESNPISFALLYYHFPPFIGKPSLYLGELYVKPEVQRQGFGTKMLHSVAKLARERKCCRLEWCAFNSNKPALSLYQSIGAITIDGLIVHRLEGDNLKKFINSNVIKNNS